jgi:asparagine N-glycosylation enzyme membrane subunit Stt3
VDTLRSWLRKNANIVIILLAIFGLALLLRAYFPFGPALQDNLLSGGSDSFYWEKTIRNIVTTGKQLDWDPMLNYPMGLGNPRPPIFNWFIAVPGIALSPIVGDVWRSVMAVFILSTAIWGALTIFPTYFLTKNIMGKRAGLVAAFLLAVMPAHLQRSQATDADHDSMTLFFVVTSFFFFMKALKALNERRWVSSWNFATKDGRSSIISGLSVFLKENQKALLYSVMSGMAMATVALIWQGWAYAPIILLVYVILQLFVDRLRDKDPMGMGICFTITMSVALLLAAPWYILYGQVKTWYDVPLILFLATAALGFVLTITRNYPWAVVLPSVLVTGGALIAILVIINPFVANAFVSGAGYFVPTKLYETIAEAQPPGLSQAMLSFGAVTYFLSLFGLFWMAWKLPKRQEPDYLFVLTWSFAAIFMSMAAARFIFNASPAFALTAGWVIVLMVGWLDFETMKKTFHSLSGGSRLTAIRKSVKVRHVLGALFIVFLLLLPNVWLGVDASIPYEDKAVYDRQVYYTMPDFLRPQSCTPPATRGGSTCYFGAFGYSLPLISGYFPAAWDWFAKQDTEVVPEQRPAYLSWWDYGFEAVDRGEHPTVADNFQDGYQLAGQFITAQSEDAAIALLTIRLIEGDYYANKGQLSRGVMTDLQRFGVDPSRITDAYHNPLPLINIVLSDPITYGRWDTRMQPFNAIYIYLSHYLDTMTTTDQIASLYHDISDTTGWSIRYFGVDSRMFPTTGSGNNIFYAPVKLSDHRVENLPDGRVLPIDFFTIEAVTDKGTFPADSVPIGATTSSLNIKYTDMFYNSMFYRAYMGFGPADVNQACSSGDCLPGIRGDLQSMMPMQGWNMSHFKAVYKTAYFNPWGVNDYQNHSEDWTAINYFGEDGALSRQRKISSNEMTGVIDFSNSTLASSGAVFLKYYDGAYINGTVTVDGVTPLPGVRVTVQDFEDPTNPTPHYSVLTDRNGKYSLLAPFGRVRLVVSTGTLDLRSMTGATVLDQQLLLISDEQAMRMEIDTDGDGLADYNIVRNIIVPGVTIRGISFLDVNKDGNQTAGEDAVANAKISFRHTSLDLVRNVTTGSDGAYLLEHAYAGTYATTVTFRGRTITAPSIIVGKMDDYQNILLNTTKIEGTVLLPGNITASGATVEAFDDAWGNSLIIRTSSTGQYGFDVLPGNFTISAGLGANATLPRHLKIGSTTTTTYNMTLALSGLLKGKTTIAGLLQGGVLLDINRVGAAQVSTTILSDETGSYSIRLPLGTYDVNARHYRQSQLYAFVGRVTVGEGEDTKYDPNFSEGVVVQGIAYSVDKTKGGVGGLNVTFNNGVASVTVRTSSADGSYLVYLPKGYYVVQAGFYNLSYLKSEGFLASQDYDISLKVGTSVVGQVFYDKNRNRFLEPGEGAEDARITFTDSLGTTAETFAGTEGRYDLTLPSNGTYLMQVSKAGFQTLSLGPSSLIALAPKFTSSILPYNVTVTGQLLLQGTPLAGESVEVDFVAKDSSAVNASVFSDASSGIYAIGLAPGRYTIKVDQPQVAGQTDVRFQNSKTETLSLQVGEASVYRNLQLYLRMSVSGTVNVQGVPKAAFLAFQGPESSELTASANGLFDLMLSEGDYTLYASYNESSIYYAAFESLTVAAPIQLQVSLDRAAAVAGRLKYANADLPEVAPISFVSEGGATFETKTDSEGGYSANLVAGNYAVNVDYPSTATIDYTKRYVRYVHSSILVVPQTLFQITYDLSLTRTLDNSTIMGRIEYQGLPVTATIEFRPDTPDGINQTAVTAADGTYSIQLTPASYMLRVYDPVSHGVSLQGINVEPRTSTYMNLSLEKGYKVTGVTTYLDHVRITTKVTFTNSINWDAYTDDNGNLEFYMPAQRYAIRMLAMLTEHGLTVGYNNTIARTIEGDISLGEISLARIPRHGIAMSYNTTSDLSTFAAGDSVDFLVRVTNTGSMPDRYQLEGPADGWTVEFDKNVIDVDFGAVNGVPVNYETVTATVKVPFGAELKHADVTITGYAVNATVNRYTLTLPVDVTPTYGIALRTTEVKPIFDGRYLNYTLEIANTGNGVEQASMIVTNPEDIEAGRWTAKIRVNSTAYDEVVNNITVGANATTRVTLVMENTGGLPGVVAKVKVRLQNGMESNLNVTTVLPRLSLEGNIVAGGSRVESRAGWNMTLIAITGAFAAVAVVFAVLAARDRYRRSRR